MTAEPGEILAILPTFNEKDTLDRVVAAVRGLGHDVLVVDDNSPDGTGELADRLGGGGPHARGPPRRGKAGLGSAYVEAFRIGLERGYRFLVEMDADGSHRIEHLAEIIAAARTNGGLGLGSRYVSGGAVTGAWGVHRKFLSWGAHV